MSLRISIVEDDAVIRESLRHLIDHAEGLRCVAAFGCAEDALMGMGEQRPGVTLMDINLPGMSGIACVRELKARFPGVEVLMLTVYGDHERIFEALRAGASGYLLKRAAANSLLEAIQQVHAGGSPISPEIARRVVDFFRAHPT